MKKISPILFTGIIINLIWSFFWILNVITYPRGVRLNYIDIATLVLYFIFMGFVGIGLPAILLYHNKRGRFLHKTTIVTMIITAVNIIVYLIRLCTPTVMEYIIVRDLGILDKYPINLVGFLNYGLFIFTFGNVCVFAASLVLLLNNKTGNKAKIQVDGSASR